MIALYDSLLCIVTYGLCVVYIYMSKHVYLTMYGFKRSWHNI